MLIIASNITNREQELPAYSPLDSFPESRAPESLVRVPEEKARHIWSMAHKNLSIALREIGNKDQNSWDQEHRELDVTIAKKRTNNQKYMDSKTTKCKRFFLKVYFRHN